MCKPGCGHCSTPRGAFPIYVAAGIVSALALDRAVAGLDAMAPVFIQLTCGLFVFAAVGVAAVARILALASALAGVRALGARMTWRAYVVAQTQVRERARRPVATRDVKAIGGSRQGVGGWVSPAMLPAGLPAAQTPRSGVPTTLPATPAGNIRVTSGPYALGQSDRLVVVVDEPMTLGAEDVEHLLRLMRMGR